MGLNVITASAGSGKTYTLVLEYVRLILKNPESFRHILAITFTNKAASEMKSRVLKRLAELAGITTPDNENDNILITNELQNEINTHWLTTSNVKIPTVQQQSLKCLNKIIHDYSAFAISTIDSFSQKIIRAFSHDVGLSSSFKVELNFHQIITQAVDNMLKKVGQDDEILTDFMLKYIKENVSREQNIKFDQYLYDIGLLLEKETIRKKIFETEFSKLNLSDFQTFIDTIKKQQVDIEHSLQALGEEAVTLIKSKNIEITSFFHGKTGIGVFFDNIANQNFDKGPNSYCRKAVEEGKWYANNVDTTTKCNIDAISETLTTIFHTITSDMQKLYFYGMILSNIHPFALLNRIVQEIEIIKNEKNILPISEFNSIIHGAVVESDAPYIYERLGNRYHNFLIDEFQDTSQLQWFNLIPLIDNSLSQSNNALHEYETNYNLIVGDSKQAIYRWRNGEVKQFYFLPKIYGRNDDIIWRTREKNFINNFMTRNLADNYRSMRKIVEFNNEFYQFVRDSISKDAPKKDTDTATDIINMADVYKNVGQNPIKKQEGYVKIVQFDQTQYSTDDKAVFEQFNTEHILNIIEDCVQSGYNLKDIAVLCRYKKHCTLIANELNYNNIPVISPDSLMLENSSAVQFVVSVLTLMSNKDAEKEFYSIVDYLHQNNFIKVTPTEIFHERQLQNQDTQPPDFYTLLMQLCHDEGLNIDFHALGDETLFEIIRQLVDTFLGGNDDIYIQQLLNSVFDDEVTPDNFCDWWEANIDTDKLCVNTTFDVDAVNVMTIHKSKGLEFPIVIVPFIEKKLKPSGGQIIIDIPYDKPDFFVVDNGKLEGLDKFQDIYDDEIQQENLEIYNLLYVATTRPKEQLYIISEKSDVFLTGLISKFIDIHVTSEDKNVYAIGSKNTKHQTTDNIRQDVRYLKNLYSNWRGRLKIAYKHHPTDSNTDVTNNMLWGDIVHLALSYLKNMEDHTFALQMVEKQYRLSTNDVRALSAIIYNLVNNMDISSLLFDYDKLYIERDMYDSDGNRYRSDRVMKKGSTYFVVDYKTGDEDEAYTDQVTRYCKIIERTTNASVTGYLLYCNSSTTLECVYSTPQIGI